MKIMVDNNDVMIIPETMKKVICNDIHADEFDDEMMRRLKWIVEHKFEQCFKRLKAEWDHKLAANGVQMLPTDPMAYAELVFMQPNYKDRKAREAVEGK